ncbi:retroviral-like aspartic protease family protein [Citromicrobium bathyomarinum]|tara:strand:+ start:1100 stop:2083 length:984 start_codon:yes stop_codon:yes gene_type:complete
MAAFTAHAAILALVAMSFAEPAQPPEVAAAALPEDAAPPAIERVRLREDGNDRLTVPVTIDGSGPYDFLIDTGAQGTILSNRLTGALGMIPSGSATIVSTAGRARVETVRIDSLVFANKDIAGLTTPVLDHGHLGADGILGLDALQGLRVLIDFRAGRMDVVDTGEQAPRSGYDIVVRAHERRGQMIIADALIDGVETAVIIDTGAQFSLGNLALLEALQAHERETVSGTDVLGLNYDGRIARVAALRLGSLQLADLPVAFADSPALDELGFADRPAMLLGIGNLRRLDRLAIDFRHRQVLFDLPDGVAPQGPSVRRARATRLDKET